jgi:Xaa-Pro aminopeptidase
MPQNARLERLAGLRRSRDLDAVLVTTPANLYYFSGFRTSLYTRFNGIVSGEGRAPVLVTALVDEELVKRELSGPIWVRDVRIHGPSDRPEVFPTHLDALKDVLGGKGRLGVDGMTLGLYRELAAAFPGLDIIDVTPELDALRKIKDATEIENLRKAARIAVACMGEARKLLARRGLTEMELAAELEHTARQLGADGYGYPILISSGERIVASHALPSAAPIPADIPFVRVAFAPCFNGYTTSVFRSFVSSTAATPAMRRYADAFFSAMAELRAMLKPGVLVGDVLETVSESYKRSGVREAWGGDAGYSLGITVQEPPRVGPRDAAATIEAGMVLALMPALRKPGEATFHHSDVFLVTDTGCECLSEGLQELVVHN